MRDCRRLIGDVASIRGGSSTPARRVQASLKGSVRGWYLIVAFVVAFSHGVHAQPIVGGEETLASDRPEGWAMNYLVAPTFSTAFGEVPALAPWRWSLATELGHIPRLSDAQRRVGFDGTKLEDLNKSPVFGRLRFALGLPYGAVAELAYTPPLEINRTRSQDLFALALGRRLLERDRWTLSARIFAQNGSVKGDITCPAALANVTDAAQNPYGCQAASRDRMTLNYYGGDVTAGWTAAAWHWHLGAGAVRTELDVQVDAITNGVRDRSRLFARDVLPYVALGARYDFDQRWSLATELMHVPLQVRRSPNGTRESDPLTSLRLQLRYRSD